VISFFELTWYTGSIYGGIDASHRYNQRRLDRTLDAVDVGDSVQPDWRELPLLVLRYPF
jgi:hypothetical protein